MGKLPKSWKCEPLTLIRLNFSAINLDDIDRSVKKQILNCLYTRREDKMIQLNQYANEPANHPFK